MPYNHIELEQKWQKFWSENQTFQTKNPGAPFVKGGRGDLGTETTEKNPQSLDKLGTAPLQKELEKPKKYILDMFPYPSGAGLHVGHPKGYTATDIVSRFYHAKGYNVLHTMGWDAFGLPAENYAIKTGTHPAVTTAANIAVFKEQLQSLGFSYDWSREIDTTDPGYYRWTQWIFLELFKRGLAYEQDLPINYCPSCKTGLANEEVLADNTCDRCGTRVEKRALRQWVLRITEYADRLIEDLDGLDWPEGVKEMQRNWIGKSEGCEFRMMKKAEGNPIALILHGWEDEGATSVHFHAWQTGLKKELEDIGYEVIMPSFPNPTQPDLEKQLAFLEQYKSKMNQDSLVIGHSMGGFLGMHFVERLEKKIGKLICVAPVFNGLIDSIDWSASMSETSWDIGSRTMKTQYHPDKIRGNVNDWQVFLSKNDPYITYVEAKKHFDDIGVTHLDIENAGHFNDGDGTTHNLFLNKVLPSIEVYTTRVDTVYGMTYAVLAPDHPRVYDFITDEQAADCEAYITEAASRSDQDRTNEGKEKTGVFTGSYVVNPFNGESVPLWIADYVLGHYGTGAVMAVPAHDKRDFLFALRYNLPIKTVVVRGLGQEKGKHDYGLYLNLTENDYQKLPDFLRDKVTNLSLNDKLENYSLIGPVEDLIDIINEFRLSIKTRDLEVFDSDGYVLNSKENSILPFFASNENLSLDVRKEFMALAKLNGFGRKKVNYKLRDWLFSRQRYWGEPIPLIHISHEDYAKLPRVEKLEDARVGEASVLSSGGTKDLLGNGADSSQARNDKNTYDDGAGEFLVIDGKIYSKIYDGINSKIIIDSHLPLMLPEVEKYEPAGDGQSPLATVESFVNVELASNLTGKRETNTMPQWGGSCWYYLRYMDPANPDALASKEALEYWQNVDEYVGGTEHAVLHLLYARFWHKVLYDIGVVPTKEPFQKLVNQGMILAYAYERPDGGLVAVDLIEEKDGKYFEKSTGTEVKQVVAKMSKSLKNVVNPNDIVREYGADSLRLYEMSMADFRDTAPWSTDSIIGVRRLLDKAYSTFVPTPFAKGDKGDLVSENTEQNPQSLRDSSFTKGAYNLAKDDMKAMKQLHKTIKKIGEDIVEYKFNTAISALQILLNEGLPQDAEFAQEWKESFAILLHPFAPHMAEELWNSLGKTTSVYEATWPEYDEFMLVDDEVTIAVQVGGKLRGTFTFLNGVGQEEVSEVVRADENIAKWLEGKEIIKEIFIPNKMLSIVVK